MRTMMLFLVLAVQLAPCYGHSAKLQEMMDTCVSQAWKYDFGAPDDRKSACASNLGNYFPTTSKLDECGPRDTACQIIEISKERFRTINVCEDKFKDGYGFLVCKDNAPGFMMAKYSAIFYPSGALASVKTRYDECCTLCADTFKQVLSCYGGCLGNLASEYLPTTQGLGNEHVKRNQQHDEERHTSSDISAHKKELDICLQKCKRDAIGYSTCTGTCLGVVMGKYASYWYGVDDFGLQASCKYEYLGLRNTEGGRIWTPCINKHTGDCFKYRVDGGGPDTGGSAYWNTEERAQNYCTDWEECWGYWEDFSGKFWAMDFGAMIDLKKDKGYRWQYSRGAFAKVCGSETPPAVTQASVTQAKCIYDKNLGGKAEDLSAEGMKSVSKCHAACTKNNECDFWIRLTSTWQGNNCWIKKFLSSQQSLNDVSQSAAPGAVGGITGCDFGTAKEEEEVRDASSDEEEVRDASLERLIKLFQELQ